MADSSSNSSEQAIPVVSVGAGDFLFRAGDEGRSFFVVSTGQIELLRRGETHRRLALLGAGDLCGEESAFEGGVRLYDARAVRPSTLLRVSGDLFLELIRVRPELAGAVIGATAVRLLQARDACLAMAPAAEPAAGSPKGTGQGARLVHVESGQQFPLPDLPEIVVGRADKQFKPQIELSSIDAHRSLSRRHAVIKRVDGGYAIVEEPRVVNGTFVNGQRLRPGVAAPLAEGDEVSFGLIVTVFHAR